ncbi:MAG TPA: phosphatase PAP2 family protein [Ignavibacteria bacterium]|nr:phosphatase PAP2 family protein [Ignavibacteria bacterium]
MKNYFKKKYRFLDIPDITNEIFLILLSVLAVLLVDSLVTMIIIILINTGLIILINNIVITYESKDEKDKSKNKILRIFRYFYPVVMILFCFKEIYVLLFNLWGTYVMDDKLIEIDRVIFGFDPTVALAPLNNPIMVEFFQIIYVLFYFMQIIFVVGLYLKHKFDLYKYSMFVIFFGFYLSFIGYLCVPAIGPRFTLHDFSKIDIELEGVFAYKFIRDAINLGESIPPNVPNPEEYAQRDAFPSGHTIVAVLIVYLAFRFKVRFKWIYFSYTSLMLFSTVYLRYHYVIDLIGSIPFILLTIVVGEYLYRNKLKYYLSESKSVEKSAV